MDPRVGDRHAARHVERVAYADRPAVLYERNRGRGVVGDGILERPELLAVRRWAVSRVDGRVEADQRGDDGA
jgi:hypothetical protein